MHIGLWFWIIFVISLLFGGWSNRTVFTKKNYGPVFSDFIVFILMFLLGWHCFGSIIYS
jgi:hypothetical protein